MIALPYRKRMCGRFQAYRGSIQRGRRGVPGCPSARLSLTGFPAAENWETTCPGKAIMGTCGLEEKASGGSKSGWCLMSDKSGMSNCIARPTVHKK